jgi:hypothetical protein
MSWTLVGQIIILMMVAGAAAGHVIDKWRGR